MPNSSFLYSIYPHSLLTLDEPVKTVFISHYDERIRGCSICIVVIVNSFATLNHAPGLNRCFPKECHF